VAEIADRLCVSRHTAATHTKSIHRKFGVSSRGEAVEHAREVGLVVADGVA
jgi:LuxR family maltose regulon positive regulatory protein